MTRFYKCLFWLTLFSIAFGFVESTVVVYLRKIYYPNGFQFPLTTLDPKILINELIREFATMIMLFAAGAWAARSRQEKIAWFLYNFAIWDIFYYVWLKALLDWPASLMTWDILFLIPIVWDGPVIAPVLVSISFILFAAVIFYAENKNQKIRMSLKSWIIVSLGNTLIIFSFCENYGKLMMSSSSAAETEQLVSQFLPTHFDWITFSVGYLLVLIQIIRFYLKVNKGTTLHLA